MADSLSAEFHFSASGTEDVLRAIDDVNARLAQAERAAVEGAAETRRAGDQTARSVDNLQRNVSAVGEAASKAAGALRGLGMNALADLVSVAGDLADLGDVGISAVGDFIRSAGGIVPALGQAGAAFGGLVAAVAPLVAPIAAAAAAVLALQKTLDEFAQNAQRVKDAFKDRVDAELEQIEIQQTASSEALRQELRINELKKQRLEEELAYVQQYLADINRQYEELGSSLNVPLRTALSQAARVSEEIIVDLSAQIEDLNKSIATTRDEILPVVEAREREAEQAKRGQSSIGGLGDFLFTLEDGLNSASKASQMLAEEIARLEEIQRRQQEAMARTAERYANDIARIDAKAAEDRAGALARYNDAIVKSAESAAAAAENALSRLQQQANNLAVQLQRADAAASARAAQDRLNAQIKYQQDEARAARDHARSLADIRRRAQQQEQELILNRDFAGLFQLERRTNDELQTAQRDYEAQRQERQIAFQQQAEDAARAFEFERQQRQIQYQQQLADAREQYQRELAEAEANRQAQLATARSAYIQEQRQLQLKHQQELAARRAAAIAELQLLQQTEAQKLQIQAAYYQQALALLRSAMPAPGNAVMPASAAAGVSNTNTSATVGITQNISSSSPAAAAAMSARAIQDVLSQIFG